MISSESKVDPRTKEDCKHSSSATYTNIDFPVFLEHLTQLAITLFLFVQIARAD